MKRVLMSSVLFFLIMMSSSCGKKERIVLISTDYGDMKVKLYNETPQHRDNFIKLAKEGFYDGTLFHRVIENFMIQGGDPNSKDAKPNVRLGGGGLATQLKQSLFFHSIFTKKELYRLLVKVIR